MRARSLALGAGALALLGGAALLVYDLQRVHPSAGAMDGGAPAEAPAVAHATTAPAPATPAPAPPRSAAPMPPAPRGEPPAQTDAPVRTDLRVERIGGRDVHWMLDPRTKPDPEGLFVAVHEAGYSPKERERVGQLVGKMLAQMSPPDPARPLADAFPKDLTEELQRTLKAPVFVYLDGRPAIWIPQITFNK